eukprot:CAMPEP_0202025900 /NCGR_PEP_ID=MMETSP0905-20130828/57558_1 /ASSEMBLY_ACC=CAM_ASM_000554 /TAXON_ID=420261 /ORGANISM="Thalassiosira antarctica, Strain CCMP982" /LENGTH=333 /DNA_ID=CAMNT_0048588951 /DNA_START=223 /DNA_END=1221 /DNA_ORIENTATION=+
MLPPNMNGTTTAQHSGFIYQKNPIATSSMTTKDDTKQCISAALVLFGVPKAFQYIHNAYIQQIVKRNPHVCFKAHMHMYNDLHQKPFINIRNEEKNGKIESPESIQAILDAEGGIPAQLSTSSQSTFDEANLSWMHENITQNFPTKNKLNLQTMMNVFRQGNSMKEAFISASFAFELQKQQEQQRHGYDMYVFARSDTLLITPIDIPRSGIGDRDLHIPGWHRWGGGNDRFALAGPIAANIWVSAKGNVFREMILDPGETLRSMEKKGRTGWNGTLGNPEKMLRLWLDANDSLNVTRGGKDWAHVIRVRMGGVLQRKDTDAFKIKQKNARDVK